MSDRSWGMSGEELLAARKFLSSKISMEQLFTKYSRQVEGTGGQGFKAICPNPSHKEGNERTPSCYFKEDQKTFHCFGCFWGGDPFDLMARLMGCPAESLVEEFAAKEKLDLGNLNIEAPPPKLDMSRINQKLSITLRDYLAIFRDTDCYEEECRWVDQAFKKIDDRLAWLEPTDVLPARQMYEQILTDLDRRKSEKIRECV